MTVKVYSPILPSVELFGAYEGIASATGINQTVSITFTPTAGTVFIVPYGDTVGRLQLETGSVPTSYIPTAGATATRAAETLTVPIANVPYPVPVEVTGTELVTNGTFDSDLTGWTQADLVSGGSSTYSIVDQKVRITSTAGNLYGVLGQSFTTDIGALYQVSFGLAPSASDNNGYILRVGTTEAGFDVLNKSSPTDLPSGVTTTVSGTFIATSTTTHITVGNNSLSSSGVYNDFDNITVKEINPLAVSIQMDGLVTYADTGSSTEAYFVQWDESTSNRIQLYIDAATGGTGQAAFQQKKDADNDIVRSLVNTYSPGVNVPFNIASRHGSTFVNGAVDGTALTANTTPTAFPDLSTTDLEIAPVFNGSIGKFIMWGDTTGDIGDIGIAEASA